MTILELVLSAIDVLALLPAGFLLVEVVAAGKPLTPCRLDTRGRPKVAVLVPAHNEASTIRRTVACAKAQLSTGDYILVVADNCNDETASVACSEGAQVVERNDRERRGKGFALDFGVRRLALDPPEVVIVIDADCTLGENALDYLARTCIAEERPAQAVNLQRSPAGADIGTRVAEFALVVKNLVRPLGLHRMRLPCQLMGTGMALPWRLLKELPLASANLVEDIALGLEAARARRAPVFCPDAIVSSISPTTTAGAREQRTRWEHGHLATILRDAPRYFAIALASRNGPLFWMVIDLCVPPLALLVVLMSTMLAATAVINMAVPFAMAALACAVFVIAIFIAWLRFGRELVSFTDLGYTAIYCVRKIPLYIKFLFKRQVEWVRSRRDQE